jgi:hypothetical protein
MDAGLLALRLTYIAEPDERNSFPGIDGGAVLINRPKPNGRPYFGDWKTAAPALR